MPLTGVEPRGTGPVSVGRRGFLYARRERKENMIGEIRAVLERDPAARNGLEVFFTCPGVHAIFWYRVAHRLHTWHLKLLARVISQTARFFTGVEIHPGATIGKGFFIDHGMGVVIGETAELGRNVTLYQDVTLGGTGKDVGKRHPTIGDNVVVGAGAKVLGPFTVGEGAKIGASAVVLKEVPPFSTVVGNPGRVVRQNNQKVVIDLDQVHLPDPVKERIQTLTARVDELEKCLGCTDCVKCDTCAMRGECGRAIREEQKHEDL